MKSEANTFYASQVWMQGAWAYEVLLEVDAQGHWSRLTPGVPASARSGAQVLTGPVLPGLVNAHSHAFQRAMAGLTERRSVTTGADDFWSWRERMYRAANRITPTQLETIATQLYAELLVGGYTHVCEFQYLHHDLDGTPYADPAEMSLALVRAAQRTGIGLTLLPTLYQRSGFSATGLAPDQRRFATTPQAILAIVESVRRQTLGDPGIRLGVALHSLRAVAPLALQELSTAAQGTGLPIHIHIAEQTQEVQDCLAHTGQRPIAWLLDHADLNERWNLVHSTHTTPAELAGVAKAGASIVICPTTEANLGDGVFDLPGYAAEQGRWSIGSDSHIGRSAMDELRWLEYSQRLLLRQRNVAAHAMPSSASSAAALLEAAVRGGSGAAGCALGGIAVGQRADFVVADADAPAMQGLPSEYWLDAMVFSNPGPAARQVFVGGQQVSGAGDPTFATVMQALWSNA